MARRKRDIPAQLRTASTASEMLQELANRTNHGQMPLQAFIAVLQHAFNGQVAIVEVAIGTCGVDVKLHGCSRMAEQVENEMSEKQKTASEKRLTVRSKARGNA